ncbi:hypothetical protein IB286_10480 [Spongiibacter sp. KMU-158]|uniref:Uncharacterized protein n=1 Tax=Spongiibacter pelagi TaxID=2760804 RepID=A0A927GXH5_9GAMM|nr:hypothetical protein [Spongiibacter pelagi]MBD2859429.1 hypothetical protein [Spongiibacter pelagi]
MPKSRKSKRKAKSPKKRLVLEYWPDKPIKKASAQFTGLKKQWHGVIMQELSDGTVEEYTIAPDSPIFLEEFLGVLKEEIWNLISENHENCGLKIYARA